LQYPPRDTPLVKLYATFNTLTLPELHNYQIEICSQLYEQSRQERPSVDVSDGRWWLETFWKEVDLTQQFRQRLCELLTSQTFIKKSCHLNHHHYISKRLKRQNKLYRITSREFIKTTKHITQTTLHSSPRTLVFWRQTSWWNSNGITVGVQDRLDPCPQ